MRVIKHLYGRHVNTRHKRYLKDKKEGRLKQPTLYKSEVTPLPKEAGIKILELAKL